MTSLDPAAKLADELLNFPAIDPRKCVIAVDHLEQGYCVIPSGMIREAAALLTRGYPDSPTAAHMRSRIIAILRSQIQVYSSAADVEPHITNAGAVANAILALFNSGHDAKTWHQCVETIMTMAGLSCALSPSESMVEFQKWLGDRVSEALPDDIRARGWSVAVHNDYRQDGVPHTFWLFTKNGRAIKGEGLTDAAALNAVRALIST